LTALDGPHLVVFSTSS